MNPATTPPKRPDGIARTILTIRRDSALFQSAVDRLHQRAECRDLPRCDVEEALWFRISARVQDLVSGVVPAGEIESFLREVIR